MKIIVNIIVNVFRMKIVLFTYDNLCRVLREYFPNNE